MSLLALGAKLIAHWILMQGFSHWAELMQGRWIQVIFHRGVLKRISQMTPSLVVQITVGFIPHLSIGTVTVIRNVAAALTMLHIVRILTALLEAFQEGHEESGGSDATKTGSIKNHVQLAKLVLIVVGGIVIVAALIDRSPLILLSGLGALSAVLMLVFKDTLLSFTAGLQLSSNNMLRVGDWVEMPQFGADGSVIDIALHTVKVQNWDKTITSIPTWRLMSESFRNWRGMSESGGRRIKRTIRLDAESVHFLSNDEIDHLKQLALLKSYLEEKQRDVEKTNAGLAEKFGELAVKPANQRRLTNLGTFRAYVDTYLRRHPGIHQSMILMVRTLEASSEGVPMELYCFASTTEWIAYENIQSNIFDHLLAILPEFGLRLYQNPTGNDFRMGLAAQMSPLIAQSDMNRREQASLRQTQHFEA